MRLHPRPERSRLPTVALLCAVLLWGSSFVATKSALEGFAPLTVIGVRMLLATALMAPLWPRLPAPARRAGDGRRLLLLVALYPCLYFPLEATAISLTTASQAGAVSAIAPLLVAVGARLFLGETLSGRAVAGLAISIGGVVVLSLGGATETAPNPALGNVLEFVALACYAVSTLVIKQLSGRYDTWLLTGLQCLAAAAVFAPAVALTPPATWASASATAWLSVVYLGLAVTLVPIGLFNYAVGQMPAARAALAVNLVPVVAILTGWLVLGEALVPAQVAACGVILGGVLLGGRGGAVGEAPAEPSVTRPGRG